MKYDINSVFVKLAIDKGINDIKSNYKRGLRNLVDLGNYFATGKLNKKTFEIMSDALKDEKSMYYSIIENLVKNVDEENLKSFFYNFGFNSLNNKNRLKSNSFIEDISDNYFEIENLKKEEVYSFIVKVGDNTNLEKLYKLLEDNTDRAFLVILEARRDLNFERIKSIKNAIFSIEFKEENTGDFEFYLKNFKTNRILYAAHYCYENETYILKDKFIKKLYKNKINIGIILDYDDNENIRKYIIDSRWNCKYPVFLVDLKRDILHINKLIQS